MEGDAKLYADWVCVPVGCYAWRSRLPRSPPFRTLSSRYPIEDLSESPAEGIVSGHPDMPIFVFSAADVEAIVDYLKSIQEKPEPAQPAQ